MMKKILKNALFLGALAVAAQASAQTTSPKQTTTATEKPAAKKQDQSMLDRIVETSGEVITSTGKMVSGITEKYSKMMQVSPSSLTNVILYQFIDDWYGTKYRLGGTGRNGIDCSALVQRLYKYVYGVDVVRTSLLQFRGSTYIAEKSNLKEGDLVFFRIHGGPVSHVGVYLGNNYFVHASSSRGVMISNLNENYWTRYYVGGGRLK
jgi:cell wall-associated NlpC family hydrolase